MVETVMLILHPILVKFTILLIDTNGPSLQAPSLDYSRIDPIVMIYSHAL